jgi:hypothetical protein
MAPAHRGVRSLRSRLLRAASAACAAAAIASAGQAQHPGIARDRSLAARLALSDAVVIATVTKQEDGRLECGEVRVLAGQVAERFTVKRAPSAPPPLGVGDRAVFLLRGARPPYVLVDQAKETIRLADASAEERWAGAISDWLAVRAAPRAWLPLYERWIDEGPDTLRELAVNGITDPAAPLQPLSDEALAGFGARAWDDGRAPAARRAYALLASLSDGGSRRLASGLLDAPLDCDADVAAAALRAAPRHTETASAVVARALDHSDAEVRRAALQTAQILRGRADAPLRARIARVASEDAESWLRAEAERTLASLAL